MIYYRKLLGTFLSVILFYTLIINVTFVSWYTISSKNDRAATIETAAKRISEYTDFQFQTITQIGNLLRSSEHAQKYVTEDPQYPDQYTRLKLYRFIKSISGVNSSRKNAIAVTKFTDNYVILPNSTGDLSILNDSFYLSREQLTSAIEAFDTYFSLPLKIIPSVDPNGNRYYTIIRREWLARPAPLYFLTSFSEDQLMLTSELKDAAFSILYDGTAVVSAGMLNNDQVNQILEEENPEWEKHLLASSVYGYQYVYLSPKSSVFEKSFLFLSLLAVAFVVVGIFLTYLLTRRMYQPIADALNSTGLSITSGNEFDQICSAFHNLNTDITKMSQSLQQYRLSLEHKFFHDLFTGLLTKEQIHEYLQQHHIFPQYRSYTAVIVQYSETGDSGTGIPNHILTDLRQKLNQRFAENFSLLRLIDLNITTQGLIVCETTPTALSETLRNILLHTEPEYGIEVTAYVGQSVEKITDIYESVRQAMRLQAHNEFRTIPEKVVTSAESLPPHSTQFVYYPITLEQSLIHSIIHGKAAVWKSTIQELVLANQSSDQLSQLALMLTATINRIIEGTNTTVDQVFEKGTIIYLEFRSCLNPEHFLETATKILTELQNYIAQKGQDSLEGTKTKMIEYVEENYQKDISLLDLANHLNISKNYASTMFKNATGKNFKDFLGEVRYQKACDLIQDKPDCKLRSVAESVGCNPDILHRLFLRYSGLTPSEYQKKVWNESVKSDESSEHFKKQG